MTDLNRIKRQADLFLIITYVVSGILVGSIIRKFIFFSVSNIWISLLFLSPLILSCIAAFLYKKGKNADIPLVLCSIFWASAAYAQLFDDDVPLENMFFLYFSFMFLISLSHFIFMAFYKSKILKKRNAL